MMSLTYLPIISSATVLVITKAFEIALFSSRFAQSAELPLDKTLSHQTCPKALLL